MELIITTVYFCGYIYVYLYQLFKKLLETKIKPKTWPLSLFGSNLPFKTIWLYIDELQKINFGNCKSKIGTCSNDDLISTSLFKKIFWIKMAKSKIWIEKKKRKKSAWIQGEDDNDEYHRPPWVEDRSDT